MSTKRTLFILLISIILTLGLSLSLQSLLAAWATPTSNPPGNNQSGPINQSDTNQVKLGGLGVGGAFTVSGNTALMGNVGINNTNPLYRLDVNGDIRSSGTFRGGNYRSDYNSVGSDINAYNIQQINSRATSWAAIAAKNPGSEFSIITIRWDGVNTLETNCNNQINSGWHAQAAIKGNYFGQGFDGNDFTGYSSVILSQSSFDNYKANGTQWWIACSTLPSFSSAAAANYWTLSGNSLYPNQTSYNLGIGTTEPDAKLRVNGTVFAYGEGNGYLLDTATASNARTGFMKYGGYEGMYVAGNGTVLRLAHRTDSAYVYGGAPTIREDLLINTSGNVGIGTNNPGYRLDIQGGIVNVGSGYGFHSVTNDSWFPYTNGSNYFRGTTYAWNNIWYDENDTNYQVDPNGSTHLSELQANIMYDHNNTSYYLNPDVNSQISSIYANNWFRSQGQTGIYFQDYGFGWYPGDANSMTLYGGPKRITNVADPVDNQDVATKAYVLASAGGALSKSQVFTSSGTFTVPNNVSAVWVTLIGGGGGGAGGGGGNGRWNNYGWYSGPGGGGGGAGSAGQAKVRVPINVTAGSAISVTIGNGGAGGTGGNGGVGDGGKATKGIKGNDGGNTSFGTLISAKGGGGAPDIYCGAYSCTSPGAAGGVAGVSNINMFLIGSAGGVGGKGGDDAYTCYAWCSEGQCYGRPGTSGGSNDCYWLVCSGGSGGSGSSCSQGGGGGGGGAGYYSSSSVSGNGGNGGNGGSSCGGNGASGSSAAGVNSGAGGGGGGGGGGSCSEGGNGGRGGNGGSGSAGWLLVEWIGS